MTEVLEELMIDVLSELREMADDLHIIRLTVQDSQTASSDKPLRICPQCGSPFRGRDAKAKFCCDAHRVRFNSTKRTPVERRRT